MPLSPTNGARNVPGRGPVASDAEPTCGFRGSTLATAGISSGLRAADEWTGDHDTGEGHRTTGSLLGCLDHHNACERARNSRPAATLSPCLGRASDQPLTVSAHKMINWYPLTEVRS